MSDQEDLTKPGGQVIESQPGHVFTKKSPFRFGRKKLVVIIILLLLIAAVGYYWYTKQQAAKTAKNPVCTEDLLHQADPLLDSAKREELAPLVDNIKSKKNYEKDASCLYIVVTYYVNVVEGKNARTYFEKLKQVYDPNKRFSLTIGSHGGIEDLQAKVEYAEARENMKVTPRYAPER